MAPQLGGFAMGLFGKKPPPQRPAESDTDQLLRIVRKVMAMIVVADGDVEAEEIEALRAAYKKICGKDLSVQDVKNEVRLTDGDSNVERFLLKVRDKLDAEDRKLVLRAAYSVANADGEVAESEDALLDRIVKALGMSDDEAKSALE
jgi:uncharacterized tellurite resistance protein B-like protein